MSDHCHCENAERSLDYPLKESYSDRVVIISKKHVDEQFAYAASCAKTLVKPWAFFNCLSLIGGIALAAATTIVTAPILLIGSTIVYVVERPRAWDHEVSLFLADECLESNPSFTNEQVLEYITAQKCKFSSYQCSYCESKVDIS